MSKRYAEKDERVEDEVSRLRSNNMAPTKRKIITGKRRLCLKSSVLPCRADNWYLDHMQTVEASSTDT